jgi:hypothetical protein
LRFTVHRPANAEVSPCCHRPSGGDVACSVHVGVARSRGAGLALENRLTLAVFGRDVPAGGASLRRVRGRDLLDPTVSLVPQSCGEQPPTAAGDTTVQPALLCDSHAGLLHGATRTAGHRPHIEGFHADRIEAPRDVRAGLFHPVLTPVGVTSLQLRNRQLRTGSPVRAALGSGKALLQHLDPPGLARGGTGGAQQFTGRQGRRHRYTTVHTHHAALTRTRDRIRDVRERYMPTASPITGDPIRLHTLRNWPRQPKSHPAHLGHPHPTEPAIQTLDVMRLDRDLPKSFMHIGFAPPRPAMRPGEEIPHRLSEIPQRLLLHRLGAGRQPVVLSACGSQLSTLLVVAGRATARPPVLVLLDGQIPHKPGMATMLAQRCRLLSSRNQPVSSHSRNLTLTTDKSTKGNTALPPPAKAGGFHAARIR